MKRIISLILLALFFTAGVFAADNVTGLWKIIDDKTGKPTAIVYLYMYQEKMYGRFMITLDTATGKIDDTITAKAKTFNKIAGNPFKCGMDFVYQMAPKGNDWVGLIMDPEPADEYDCVIKKDGLNLAVRGQLKGLGFLGRNQKWVPSIASDIPSDVTLPDPSTFVPVIPKKK